MAVSLARAFLAIGIPQTALIAFQLLWCGAAALEAVRTQRRGERPRRGWLLWAALWAAVLTPLVLLALLFTAWAAACAATGGCL